MRPETTAAIYATISKAYRLAPDPEAVEVWHRLMDDPALGITDEAALLAARRLCQRTPFPLTPADVIAEAQSSLGITPPAMGIAEGRYLAGDWSAHPAIERAARKVFWDRRTDPRRALEDFRALYAVEVDEARASLNSPPALGATPLIELPQEGDHGGATDQ